MSEQRIIIRGAREHNLKNIDLELPRNALIVITGVSGSGKSSLAFDTLSAEGQRRYVESLSAYARQFLTLQDKPDVDAIEGLSPSIAIEQKSTSRNPRSTVGTMTEIHDYLRLLYARIGHPFCPDCNHEITSQTISRMVDHLLALEPGSRLLLLAPIVRGRKGEYRQELGELQRQGFTRLMVDGTGYVARDNTASWGWVDEAGTALPALDRNIRHTIEVVVDRLIVKTGIETRLADSIETALRLAQGILRVEQQVSQPAPEVRSLWFSERHACIDCNFSYPDIEPRLFSFNSPFGACAVCGGLGIQEFFDPERIIANPECPLSGHPVTPWNSPLYHGSGRNPHDPMLRAAQQHNIDLHTPWHQLPAASRDALLNGTAHWEGILGTLERRYRESDDDALREELRLYRVTTPCTGCQGRRLRREALNVRIGGLHIGELSELPLRQTQAFLDQLALSDKERAISTRILREIVDRLDFLIAVGLDYLTLNRTAGTLSGGESQRIRLANQIGSGLVGVLYILDEPSIGLHPRDNQRLLDSLLRLRNLGNTVLLVEHDEEAIRAADYLVDLGPGPGEHGGHVVAAGTPAEIEANPASLTGQYLSGQKSIPLPGHRRPVQPDRQLRLQGVHTHNLHRVDVGIPLGLFVCITGVSGSGKSSLVLDTLYPAARQYMNGRGTPSGPFDAIAGLDQLDKTIHVDQSPIGRTPRSNPATYTGLFTPIRELFASVPEARARGYTASRFSFNVKGGRCEGCLGEGLIKVEMHFLPDLFVPCDQCNGRRYNRETLEITWKQMTIADVLALTIEQAAAQFQAIPAILSRLLPLVQVGLGYIRLGQSATTLSGGEAQRIKIARELSRRATGNTLYILDEPTTGLHFDDIRTLLEVLHRLSDQGNSVLVIEHNLDVIKSADWIIDLGPEGGSGGGRIVGSGTPEMVARCAESWTGRFLAPLLASPTGLRIAK
jgi:excinuclease ABC subunit A